MQKILFLLFMFNLQVTKVLAFDIDGTIVRNDLKIIDHVVLPISAVYFKEESNKANESGFTAASLLELNGSVKKTIRDHRQTETPQVIIDRFIEANTNGQSEVIFRCHADECGDQEGFRAFFSSQLNDNGKHQRYVVIKSGAEYKALYVVNIDNTPRSLSLLIRTMKSNEIPSGIIDFSSGSSELSHAAKMKIQSWCTNVAGSARNSSISVVGYTDDSGSAELNIALAKSRAEAVKNFLINELAISEQHLVVHAVGEFSRPKSVALGRYVELSLVQ